MASSQIDPQRRCTLEHPLRIALLTPPGRGALAVVTACGLGAVHHVSRLFAPQGGPPLAARPDGSIIFGRWGDPQRGEDLVVVRHAADQVEIHCHGGLAASAAVMASLESLGSLPTAGFSMPPVENRISFGQSQTTSGSGFPPSSAVARRLTIDREAREALARVAGPRATQILCWQLAGALADEFDRIDALRKAGDPAAAAAAITRLRQAARVGLRLVDPWRVVLVGPVNAGKSSLVNALAGYGRSIVSAEPGTTRDVVATRLVLGGWEIDLIDTAGLRGHGEATSSTEQAGIERATVAAAAADLVLEVFPIQNQVTATAFPTLSKGETPVLQILSKCDLIPGIPPLPVRLLTSARTRQGIDALSAAILATLVPEEKLNPSLLSGPVPFTSRQTSELTLL